MWSVKCRMWSVECKVWGGKCGVGSASSNFDFGALENEGFAASAIDTAKPETPDETCRACARHLPSPSFKPCLGSLCSSIDVPDWLLSSTRKTQMEGESIPYHSKFPARSKFKLGVLKQNVPFLADHELDPA